MHSSPIIRHGWLRVLVFLIGYMLLIFFGSTLIDFLVVLAGLEATTETLFYSSITLNFIIAFATVSLFRSLFDRKSLSSLGLTWKGFGRERAAGILTGILLLSLMAVVLWFMKLLDWFVADVDAGSFLIATFMLVLVSLSEELVFRGYVLNNLMQSMPREAALFTSAVLFAVFHSLNPNFNLLAFINIFIAGMLLGINYIYTRNLWFAIFFHFSWNFFQGPVLGFEVSGLSLPSLLDQNLKGSILLTGGAFGLEASWLTTFTTSLMTIILFFLFQRKYSNVE
ncbi:MAG: CPBP family intramembrane metalloprotease [Chitinophagaceae bacterium]|nr:CPBP family intramembrane metalloprotease [Chitinophagaceae bacterium]